MKIEIHDVDHGACAVITSPSGHRLMLDCGQNLRPGHAWFPSITYAGERIDTLMLLNLDRDHLDDLRGVWASCPIGALVTNPTVTAAALGQMKREHGMCANTAFAQEVLRTFGGGFLGDWQNSVGGVQWHAFWNRYGQDFVETNDLSLAVFVTFAGFTILFGGDMEKAGWRRLLGLADFRRRLADVTVFVASHHGRENGKCEELFAYCAPELIVMSDGPKQHGTQETTDWYGRHATGIPDRTRTMGLAGYPKRRVVSTRRDGTITFHVEATGSYTVLPERTQPDVSLDAILAALQSPPVPPISFANALMALAAPSPAVPPTPANALAALAWPKVA